MTGANEPELTSDIWDFGFEVKGENLVVESKLQLR